MIISPSLEAVFFICSSSICLLFNCNFRKKVIVTQQFSVILITKRRVVEKRDESVVIDGVCLMNEQWMYGRQSAISQVALELITPSKYGPYHTIIYTILASTSMFILQTTKILLKSLDLKTATKIVHIKSLFYIWI